MKTRILFIACILMSLPAQSFCAQVPAKWEITWTDHTGNPVDLGSPGSRAYMPFVLYNTEWPAESRFRIWYDSESIAGLAYSSSADGLNWAPGVALSGINTAAASADGTAFAGRAVVLYQQSWAKPYRLYYYGKTDLPEHQIWVAESADGVRFENNQIALDPAVADSRLGTFPDGHAVVYLPGRNPTPDDPTAERPFIMYFPDKGGQGIAYAASQDGYKFTEVPDDTETPDVVEGLIEVSDLDGAILPLVAHPTQVLQLAQNDLRMWAFSANTSIMYLVSANGLKWQLIEDPVPVIGATGAAGAWNDERNYYASAAYLGEGRFYLLRGGRNIDTGLYRSGAAFGQSAFYQANDLGKWAFYSPMDNYQAEGWGPFTSTENEPDGTVTAIIQNADGTASVRDRKESGNFYMVRDAAWLVPFTFEFRAKLDEPATTEPGTEESTKYTFAAFQSDELNPGAEAWQPAFSPANFGRWTLADDSEPTAVSEADNTQFQTYTVVCRFDESARAQLAINPTDGTANQRMGYFEVYLNRDFAAPKATYFGTGFVGWPSVDADGRLDIGFPGPASGQLTVDWVRWGNGIILDPSGPDAVAPPTLTIARAANGVTVSWTGGGTLQSASELTGPWNDEAGVTSGSTLPVSATPKFYRVRL